MTATLLFLFQVIMAWVYVVPQVISLNQGKVGGLTLTMWVAFIGYLSVSLSLAVMAWKEKRETIRLFTVIIFAQWIVFTIVMLAFGFRTVAWSDEDSVVTIVITLMSVGTIWRLGLKNPMTRGWLAVWSKAVPQLWSAHVMWAAQNSEWLPALSLLATHATSLPRFVQVYLQGRRGGWDTPTKGLMLGESANIISWLIVTIVWFTV
jgi:hypothetical protein